MTAIEKIEASVQELRTAKAVLTQRQRFEMGWALDAAISSLDTSLHALRHPQPDSFYEGMDI